MPATLTLRDLPDDTYGWIKRQAAVHHRSVNKEVIALLEAAAGQSAPSSRASVEELMEIARQCASAPDLDRRSADQILGYDAAGLPG